MTLSLDVTVLQQVLAIVWNIILVPLLVMTVPTKTQAPCVFFCLLRATG
jgi:hypothetical protein